MKKVTLVFVLAIMAVPVFCQGDDGGTFSLNFWTILSGALAVLGTVLAKILTKVKGKGKEAIQLGLEVGEAFMAYVSLGDLFVKAVEDNTVTPEEVTAMKAQNEKAKKERADVTVAFRKLIGKV